MTKRQREFFEWLAAMVVWFAAFVVLGMMAARHV
jgi:hypothetical protein